jgi:hypothetical protein
VMQELARAWGHKLVGLNPASHRLHGWTYRIDGQKRETADRIFASYDALWSHFGATEGPLGWVILPIDADDKLAATALSPEKRERQVRRADFWMRTRKTLRVQMRDVLLRPGREERLSRVTQVVTDNAPLLDDDWEDLLRDDEEEDRKRFEARIMQTGPMVLDRDDS